MSPDSAGPHRFAIFLACCVILLITAGGLVKSLEAGLSVPDWPTSYGGINPPNWWTIENVRAEHGHRLIAGTVAALTVFLAAWLRVRDDRRGVRRLSVLAVLAVLLQALLGGLTVLFFLPKPISIGHAALAQIFLCLIVAVAVTTSRAWPRGVAHGERRQLLSLAPVLTIVVFLQILIGAIVRHLGAGLAIPDFPLAFGRLIPPQFTLPIALHYTHRLGALAVALLGAAVIYQATQRGWRHVGIWLPALLLGGLVVGQITLGALVVLTERQILPNTVHVGVGSMLLATSLILSLHSWKHGGRREVEGSVVALREATS